jgi:hypothetical protein
LNSIGDSGYLGLWNMLPGHYFRPGGSQLLGGDKYQTLAWRMAQPGWPLPECFAYHAPQGAEFAEFSSDRRNAGSFESTGPNE